MITNPIPKNGFFATLNANDVAGIIAGLPEEHRHSAYMIYFGTVNNCSAHVDATIEAYHDERDPTYKESLK